MKYLVVLGVRGPDRDLQEGEVVDLDPAVARLLGASVVPVVEDATADPGKKRGAST